MAGGAQYVGFYPPLNAYQEFNFEKPLWEINHKNDNNNNRYPYTGTGITASTYGPISLEFDLKILTSLNNGCEIWRLINGKDMEPFKSYNGNKWIDPILESINK